NDGLRERLYPFAIIVAAYMLALMGGYAIGATKLGIFVVGGMIAGIAGIIIGLRPQFGLYILIFFVFTNMSDVLEVAFGIPDSNKALVALIVVGTLASVVMYNKPLIFRMSEIAVLAFGVAILISLFAAERESRITVVTSEVDPETGETTVKEPPDMADIMIDWFKDFAILFVVVQLSTDERVWKNTHWVLILGAGFLALLSVYQTVSKDYKNDFYGMAKAPVHEITTGNDSVRLTGPLDDPNYYAMIHTMALPTAVYVFVSTKSYFGKGIATVLGMLILATILFTFSRGAFLALMVIGILAIRDLKLNPYKIAAMGVLLLAILSPVMPKGFTERMATLTGIIPQGDAKMQTESSFRGRTSEALVAIQMYADNPILGVGKKNYAKSYLQYSSRLGLDDRLEDRQAHSLYLETAAEGGTVGLIVFAAMMIVVFRETFNAKKMLRIVGRHDLVYRVTGIQLGLVGYLMCSIFLHSDYERYFWLVVALALGCSVLAAEKFRQYEARRRNAVIDLQQESFVVA
ncbi:MAG: O-antigen ligase family protein, partial [Anaerolineae bacterium]|nr:O-antigen ligase family protein [Anaerolineae bacterium]